MCVLFHHFVAWRQRAVLLQVIQYVCFFSSKSFFQSPRELRFISKPPFIQERLWVSCFRILRRSIFPNIAWIQPHTTLRLFESSLHHRAKPAFGGFQRVLLYHLCRFGGRFTKLTCLCFWPAHKQRASFDRFSNEFLIRRVASQA